MVPNECKGGLQGACWLLWRKRAIASPEGAALKEIHKLTRPFELSRANMVLGASLNALQVKSGHIKPKLVKCMDQSH